MDHFEKENTCAKNVVTPEAIHRRLVAIRLSTGQPATTLAESAGIKYTTFKSQEAAGSPSLKLLSFYWRAFDIDPNFVFGGDFSRIHPDTLESILGHLAALNSKA